MTIYPHRIRLRGPWECEPLACARPGDPLPPPRRMALPARWGEAGLGDFAGRVRFRRRFGYPGQIDSDERVWLTFAGVEGIADVSLNGRLLGRCGGAQGPFEFEITALLDRRNELTVDVEAAGGGGGLWGEVALEVRRTAFLRGVRVRADLAGGDVAVEVAGEVVGACAGPLDLYVLLDNATVAYAVVEADPAGRPFRLRSEALPPERWRDGGPRPVRVELVQGAVVWYAVEATCAWTGTGRTGE